MLKIILIVSNLLLTALIINLLEPVSGSAALQQHGVAISQTKLPEEPARNKSVLPYAPVLQIQE